MTQASNLVAVFQVIGSDIGTLIGNQGQLNSLTTTDKTTLVAALNELKASITGGGGAAINDAAPSTSSVYSSSKTQSVADAAASAMINDTTASADKTYSSTKINAQINAAIAAVVDGAPEAFNTLKELADYIASDESAVAAMTTAINNRVRYDAAQALTTAQQIQASQNIGVGDITTDFVSAYTTAKV